MVENNKSDSWSKHIDIKYLTISEHVKGKIVVIEYISTKSVIVDPMIKDMSLSKFKIMLIEWDLVPLYDFCCKNECYLWWNSICDNVFSYLFLICVHIHSFEKYC